MSSQGAADISKPGHPQRPRHQISRSMTETPSIPKLRHSLLLQRRHHDRNSEHSFPTIPMPPHESLDIPRSEGVTPYMMSSAEQSCRTSVLPPGAEDVGILAVGSAAAPKDKQIQAESGKAALRSAGLKKSVMDLSSFSLAATRRLDNTYYSVLEKLSMLQSTIIGIKSLAGMSQETRETFKTDSRSLVSEVESQLDALGQFDEQQKRIESLQSRIHKGRQKVQRLSERVDVVREQVEGWERADREWQEKIRRRLKILWIITSILLLVILLLFAGVHYAPSEMETMKQTISDMMSSNGSVISSGGQRSNSTVSAHLSQDIRAALDQARDNGPVVDEEILRAFDEL